MASLTGNSSSVHWVVGSDDTMYGDCVSAYVTQEFTGKRQLSPLEWLDRRVNEMRVPL